MQLSTYLERKKITITDFAKSCKMSRATIYNIMNGTFPPRGSSMLLIAKVTDGEVTMDDLIRCRKKTKPKKLAENKQKI